MSAPDDRTHPSPTVEICKRRGRQGAYAKKSLARAGRGGDGGCRSARCRTRLWMAGLRVLIGDRLFRTAETAVVVDGACKVSHRSLGARLPETRPWSVWRGGTTVPMGTGGLSTTALLGCVAVPAGLARVAIQAAPDRALAGRRRQCRSEGDHAKDQTSFRPLADRLRRHTQPGCHLGRRKKLDVILRSPEPHGFKPLRLEKLHLPGEVDKHDWEVLASSLASSTLRLV